MKLEKIGLIVKLDFSISLWQAIKLRIAGKNYQPVVFEILREIKETLTDKT